MAPHADQDAECGICKTVAASGPEVIWEDSRWLCSHCDPAPLPGWYERPQRVPPVPRTRTRTPSFRASSAAADTNGAAAHRLMFYSQRHVQGPAKFNSDEAANVRAPLPAAISSASPWP